MKVDRYAYTNNFEHLRLHLGTEFQLDLSYKMIVYTYLPNDQHDQYMYHHH